MRQVNSYISDSCYHEYVPRNLMTKSLENFTSNMLQYFIKRPNLICTLVSTLVSNQDCIKSFQKLRILFVNILFLLLLFYIFAQIHFRTDMVEVYLVYI